MKTYFKSIIPYSIPRNIFAAMFVILAMVVFTLSNGCNDDTTASNTYGQISMTGQYSSSNSPSNTPTTMMKHSGVSETSVIDSLKITRARFVIRDIKFKTQSDSSMFRATPFVLELNLTSAMQEMSVANVPYGTYRKIEFDVHRINANEAATLSPVEQTQFQDFLAGDTFSIIISGSTYTNGVSAAFTFRSRLNVKQKLDMSPEIIINHPSPAVNATMLVSSGGWFRSSTGALLDPTDSTNENAISDNLRTSIKVFKDDNKDGSKDSN